MAERINFTKRTLNALPTPAGKRAYYYDTLIPNLQIAVTPYGVKTFYLYRKIKGRPTRIKLGRYPDLTPAKARDQADRVRGEIADGETFRGRRLRREAEAVTLAETFRTFQNTRKTLKPKTRYLYERFLETVFADWKRRKLTEITPRQVARRHATIGEKHGTAYADGAMRFLRSLYNFALAEYEDAEGRPLLPPNPVHTLSKKRAWYKPGRRTSLIKAHQLPAWFEAVNALRKEPAGSETQTIGDYLLFVVLTGLRRSEAAQLRWDQVDLEDRTFTLIDTKNREPHTLPLSDYLADMLRTRRSQQMAGGEESALPAYVFDGTTGDGYLGNGRRAVARVIEDSGVPFTLHDLRRTFATVAESLDIPAYALKRLLNHKSGRDVTAGYLVIDVERLRRPMQQITDHVLSLAGGRPVATVAELAERRSRVR